MFILAKYDIIKGYTLMELMTVVGIIAVVVAIAIPSVIAINRSLKFKQRNDYAKTVFIAAQTNLTDMRSSGDIYACPSGLGSVGKFVGDIQNGSFTGCEGNGASGAAYQFLGTIPYSTTNAPTSAYKSLNYYDNPIGKRETDDESSFDVYTNRELGETDGTLDKVNGDPRLYALLRYSSQHEHHGCGHQPQKSAVERAERDTACLRRKGARYKFTR